MRAISVLEPGRVGIVEIAEPRVGPGDVLIDVHLVGLCGSDLHAYQGTSPMVSYPRVLGHEVSGVIAAVGEGVPASLPIGRRATVVPTTECGVCPACQAGRPNCCQFNETLGVQRDGALTARISVPYTKVYASDTLSAEELVLVEPMSVGYHAANRGEVSEVDTVLVFGCGAIGIGAIAASARKGARVIAVDIDDAKLALARRFGAQETIHSRREDVLERARALTDGEGPRVAIEAVGLPQTYRLAVEAVCYAGRVVYIGYANDEVRYDSKEFVRKELDIRGSRNQLRAFPAVIGMFERRERPFLDLITRTYPFAEAGQALADWAAAPGEITKLVIDVRD